MIPGKSSAKEPVLLLGELGRYASRQSAAASCASSACVAARSRCGGWGSRGARNGVLPKPSQGTGAVGAEERYDRDTADEYGREM